MDGVDLGSVQGRSEVGLVKTWGRPGDRSRVDLSGRYKVGFKISLKWNRMVSTRINQNRIESSMTGLQCSRIYMEWI